MFVHEVEKSVSILNTMLVRKSFFDPLYIFFPFLKQMFSPAFTSYMLHYDMYVLWDGLDNQL